MFLFYPDMHRPSLNPMEQKSHLKYHAKWMFLGRFIGVKANGPYIEVSGTRQRIPRFAQMAITC
jgi:hypothetical protein